MYSYIPDSQPLFVSSSDAPSRSHTLRVIVFIGVVLGILAIVAVVLTLFVFDKSLISSSSSSPSNTKTGNNVNETATGILLSSSSSSFSFSPSSSSSSFVPVSVSSPIIFPLTQNYASQSPNQLTAVSVPDPVFGAETSFVSDHYPISGTTGTFLQLLYGWPNAYIQLVGTSLSLSFTVMTWLKFSTSTSSGCDFLLISNVQLNAPQSFNIRVIATSSQQLTVVYNQMGVSHSYTLASPITLAVWYHVALAYNYNTNLMQLYWNGALIDSQSGNSTGWALNNAYATPLLLNGAVLSGENGVGFSGLFYKCGIYWNTLNSTAIQSLYNSG
jgi:flagellar basal body-associated protein FliL